MECDEVHPGPCGRASAGWRWAATLVAAMAAMGAGYLAYVSLTLGATPAGCGPGSSCGDILSSAWAKCFGVPVSLLAVPLYLTVIALIQAPARPVILRLRAAAAGAIGGAAVWFILLQGFVLHAFCPYCMADHILGFAVAALLLVGSSRAQPGRWVLAGVGAAALLALGQALQPRPLTRLAVSSAGDFDRITPAGRELGIQDGRLRLQVGAEPRFGSVTAHTVVAVMFDYACPHCRHVHRFCRALAERSGNLLALALPTPLGAACNRYIPETEERFRESCDLARLSLAVFYAAPARWADYDRWLFETERPRSAEQARAQAATLLGNALAAALQDARVERMLQRNVAAFGAIPAADPAARRLPVTWSPGRPALVGPVESAGAFVDWLNHTAGRAATEPATKPPHA